MGRLVLIKGRHIRHDWRTFNDRQDQKSVRTLCNVTSTPKMSGIPTVTDQKAWLTDHDAGVATWGWCWSCTRVFIREWRADNTLHAHVYVQEIYSEIGNAFAIPAKVAIDSMKDQGRSPYATPTRKLPPAPVDDGFN